MKLVRKWKKKKLKVTKLERYQTCSEPYQSVKDLQSINVEESMDKQKAEALVMDDATIGEDIDDYIDENM